ncbi:hypothetical protein GCM10010401_11930 [Rarobacter faecitabidus]|uniref:hypothetical protein n=1 Tax=Rarobacter faecitabidus TaxID=13243 RepID=UPI0011512C4C|nr:hypothetical protein [Rarobacter faecitabidus]
MGHAGLIIMRTDTHVRFFDDHSQARVSHAIVDGPAGTTLHMRESRAYLGELSDCVSALRHAESCLLINVPRREVIWFDYSFDSSLPRLVNHLLELNWPGWQAVWSPLGIGPIAARLGLDAEPVLDDQPIGWRVADLLGPAIDPVSPMPISVSLADGFVSWRSELEADQLALLPPGAILDFARDHRHRTGDGWGLDLRHPDYTLWCGLHMDESSRTVYFWTAEHFSSIDRLFATHWPGWRFVLIGDFYEWHELRGVVLRRDWYEDLAKVRQDLTGQRAAGGSRLLRAALAEVSSLESRASPLPPASFIDSTGSVQRPDYDWDHTDPRFLEPESRAIGEPPDTPRRYSLAQVFEDQVRLHRKREVRGDTNYDSPHKDGWFFDLQGTLSPRAAALGEALRGIGFAGRAIETTDASLPGQVSLGIELRSGHWLGLQCFFADEPADVNFVRVGEDVNLLAGLTRVVTVMVEEPVAPGTTRVHRIVREFISAQDDPPQPLGYQYSGGIFLNDLEPQSARPFRTLLRGLWETCFHADLVEVFRDWADGCGAGFELRRVDTDVSGGRRLVRLEFAGGSWGDDSVWVELPLSGDETAVRLIPSAAIGLERDLDAIVEELIEGLGLLTGEDMDPTRWLALQLTEAAHDAYYGRVQQGAFRPSAR